MIWRVCVSFVCSFDSLLLCIVGSDDKKFVEAYKLDAKRHGYEGEKLMQMARDASEK